MACSFKMEPSTHLGSIARKGASIMARGVPIEHGPPHLCWGVLEKYCAHQQGQYDCGPGVQAVIWELLPAESVEGAEKVWCCIPRLVACGSSHGAKLLYVIRVSSMVDPTKATTPVHLHQWHRCVHSLQ